MESIMPERYDEGNEHFLLNLIRHCWGKKWHFIIPMAVAAVLLVGFCLISASMDPWKSPLPNKYTSTAKIIVRETSSVSGISSSLSALASMGGVDLGGGADSSNGVLLTTIADTISFKDAVISEFGLIERYNIEKHVKSNSRKELGKHLSIELDEDTNVLSLSFTDIDPEFAQEVASFAVDLLMEQFYAVSEDDNSINLRNYQEAMDTSFKKIVEYQKDIQNLEQSVSSSSSSSIPSIMFDVQMKKLELEAEETIYASFKGQYELLAIQTKDDPITLKLIQKPEVPDIKSAPSRAMICIIGEFIVFVFCFAVVFMKYYLSLSSKKEGGEAPEEAAK